jgi:PAS domain S-box-containing protein
VATGDGVPRLTEAHLRLAFDTSPSGNGIIGRDGRFLRVNRALADLLGAESAEQLVGRSWVTVIEPDDQKAVIDLVASLHGMEVATTTAEVGFTHRSGRRIHTVLRSTPSCSRCRTSPGGG